MNDTLDFAKAYLSFGWSLIPIVPDTKQPAVKWAEYQTRKSTITEVKEWLKKGWYLAVVTGDISGILIVDDDRIKHNLPEWGFESPVVATSTSGGKHYYYKYDREIHSHSNTELFVDLKAWHSYCLVPPFKDRVWISKPSKNLAKLSPLSDEIVRLINSNKKTDSQGNSEPLRMADFVNIPEGARTESLHRVACSIFNKIKKDDGMRILAGVNQTYSPPLDGKEFNYQISRAYEFVESQKATKKEIQLTQTTLIGEGTDLRFVNIQPIHISDISSDQSVIDWAWEGYLAKSELTLCSALPKVGKSTLIAHFLKCLQNGESLAGQPIKKSKVLVISEESKGIWARKRDDLELEGDIWIIPQPFTEKPSYRQWIDLIEFTAEFCKKNAIDLVIIDTITSFWHVRDEGNAPEVQAALLPLNLLTNAGIGVLIVHHHRKAGGEEGIASRGSTAFGSAVSIVLEITRKERDNPNNSQRVLKTFSRFEESPPEIVIELVGDKYETLGTSAEVSRQARLDKVLSIIPVAPKGITTQDVLDAWEVEELGKKPSRSSIVRYLNDLKDSEKIIIVDEILTKRAKTPLYGKIATKNETQITPPSLRVTSRSEDSPNAEPLTFEQTEAEVAKWR